MDYEKIIEALKTIKEVCIKSSDCCETCSFFKDEDCEINETSPALWDIKEPDEIKPIIKVFK